MFITGTDTDVGKTIVTTCLAGYWATQGLKVAIYKPVQTGGVSDLDLAQGLFPDVSTLSTYSFPLPATPELAGAVDVDDLQRDYRELARTHDLVLVEGAGGACVPLANGLTMLGLARFLRLPVLVVANNYLGCINHTCLTLSYAKRLDVKVRGFLFSRCWAQGSVADTNPSFIETYGDSRYLGTLGSVDLLNPHQCVEAMGKLQPSTWCH